jgi:hypothetical protein
MVLNREDGLKPLCWKGMGRWLVDELRRTLDALEELVNA